MLFHDGVQGPIGSETSVDGLKAQNDKYLRDLVGQVVSTLKGLNEGLKSKQITLEGIEIPLGAQSKDINAAINSWPGFSNPKAIGIACLARFVGDEAVIGVDLYSANQTGWGKKSAVKELDPAQIREAFATHAPNFEVGSIGKPTTSGVAHMEYASLSFELREKRQGAGATMPPATL